MNLPVRNIEGKEVRSLEVDDSVFGIQPNQAVLHQAFVIQRNNQRWGTANTKTRGEVQGSTRKIRAQKYTGKARAGSNRSPTRVGGGIVFGPRQRDYSQKMPKKMRRLAIRSALSGKAADGQLVVIDRLSLDAPKTKEIVRLLHAVGMQRSALLVTAQSDRTVLASVRNLQKTKVLPAAHLNVVDMVNHAGLLMTEEAVRQAERLWGRRPKVEMAPVEEERPAAKPRRAARAVIAPVEEKRPAAKPRRAAKAVIAPVEEKRPAAKPRRAPKAAAAAIVVTEATPEKAAKVKAPRAKAPAQARKAPTATKRPSVEVAAPAVAEKPKRAPRAAAKPAARKAAAPKAPKAEAKAPQPRRTKKTPEGEA